MANSFERTLSEVSRSDGTLKMISMNASKLSDKSFLGRSYDASKKTPSRRRYLATPHSEKKSSGADSEADRYIPVRVPGDSELNHFLLTRGGEQALEEDENNKDYQNRVANSLNPSGKTETRILSFSSRAPQSHKQKLLLNGASVATSKPAVSRRLIPKTAEKVLDAPETIDDYYLNTLDWGGCNLLAVALSSHVYVWNAVTGSIDHLLECGEPEEYVCSVRWYPDTQSILAVGTNLGRVQIWDAAAGKLVRTMMAGGDGTEATPRIPSLAWNDRIVSSGSRFGRIRHHDISIPNHEVANFAAHENEIAGLSWSPDGKYIASGGNDNRVRVWSSLNTDPLHTFTAHTAAVKAVSWCPWKPSFLATGGGFRDQHMRFWSADTGTAIKAVDTGSQVCGIIWDPDYREIITGHGQPDNQLSIWKYPSMSKITDLHGHTDRILCLTQSPDSQMIASNSADETIRIWKCSEKDKTKKSKEKAPQPKMFTAIR